MYPIAVIEALQDMGYSKEDLFEYLDENPDNTIIDFVGNHKNEFFDKLEYHQKRLRPQ